MIDLNELKRKINEQVGEATLERDYVIGWILKSIYEDDLLKDILIFKGGTALRKGYFSEYRFSADLDFTAINYVDENVLKTRFEGIIKKSAEDSGISFLEIEFEQTRDEYNEEAFEIKIPFIGPRQHKNSPPKIKVQITRYEKLFFKPEERELIHLYSDNKDCKAKLKVYSLEEIIGEKLRALHQRVRPRDLYDLHYLLTTQNINKIRVCECFLKKCEHKKVDWNIDPFEKSDDFKNAWNSSLEHLIINVPDFNDVVKRVKGEMSAIKNMCRIIKNRDLILLAEIGALIHDIGKLNEFFIKKQSIEGENDPILKDYLHGSVLEYDSGTNINFYPNNKALESSAKKLKDLLERVEISYQNSKSYKSDLYLLLKQHHPDKQQTQRFPDKIVELLSISDSFDAGEDRGNANNKQSMCKTYKSTAFGYEKDVDVDFNIERKNIYVSAINLINACDIDKIKDNRDKFIDILKESLGKSLGMTARAANDVSLWEHSYMTASIMKALLCEGILNKEEKEFPVVKNKQEILGRYLFSWGDIPENSTELIKFLKDDLKMEWVENAEIKKSMEWVENAEIKKSNDGKIITVTNEEKSIRFKLNKEKGKVILEVSSEKNYKYELRENNSKLNIYLGPFKILSIDWDFFDFISQSHKIPDVSGRVEILREIKEEVKRLIETEFLLGNCIYEDDYGLHFLIPASFSEEKIIKEGIYKIINTKTEGILVPYVSSTASGGSLVKLLSEAKGILENKIREKEIDIDFKPEWIKKWNESNTNLPKNKLVCNVCSKGFYCDGNAEEICEVCKRIRDKGRKEKPPQTTFIDEIAWNGKDYENIALVVLNFNLKHWLDGEHIKSLFLNLKWKEGKDMKGLHGKIMKQLKGNFVWNENTQKTIKQSVSELLEEKTIVIRDNSISNLSNLMIKEIQSRIDKNETLRDVLTDEQKNHTLTICVFKNIEFLDKDTIPKSPSPSRMMRVWNNTREFFEELEKGICEKALTLDRCIIEVNKIPDVGAGAWESEISANDKKAKKCEIIFKENECITVTPHINNFIEENKNKELIIKIIDKEWENFQKKFSSKFKEKRTIRGYRTISLSPNMFMFLVPSSKAVEIIKEAKDRYMKQFGKVYGKLPLNAGVVFFKRKTPFYACLDSARRFINCFKDEEMRKK